MLLKKTSNLLVFFFNFNTAKYEINQQQNLVEIKSADRFGINYLYNF